MISRSSQRVLLPALPNAPAAVPAMWELPDAGLEDSVVHRFAQVAAEHPEQAAVVTAKETLTYGGLSDRAGRLAQGLAAAGVHPGDRVALLLGQTAGMVAGWLGVIQCGGIAVPLDPSLPAARLAVIVEDADPVVILVDAKHRSFLPRLPAGGCRALEWEALMSGVPGGGTLYAEGRQTAAPGDCVYLLYTSGSTGQPRGVMQTHRNLLRNVRGLSQVCSISREDRIAGVASFCMSQGVATLFVALLNGATLYPYHLAEEGLGPLAGWMQRHRMTVFTASVSVFRRFAATLQGASPLPHLRVLRLGTEELRTSDVRLYRQHFPRPCVLVNCLGSTETNNYARCVIDHDTVLTGNLAPVGTPPAGTRLMLVDAGGDETPPGTPGEIVVQSDFLSPGYWRDPGLTAARFQADGEGRRCYRTGDVGRWLPDGSLEYLGRTDHQTKIRGNRVEIKEIERVLRDHPDIEDAVVSVRRTPDTELVAHVQTRLTAAGIRTYLAGRLPDAMKPALIVPVEQFPLAPSGKVDRGALLLTGLDGAALLPRDEDAGAARAAVRLNAGLEEALVRCWSTVLGVPPDRIGLHEDFMNLGGDSLKALQLFVEIEGALGLAYGAQDVAAAFTVAAMAEQARSGVKRGGSKGRFLVPLRGRVKEEGDPVFFLPGGWGGDNEVLAFAVLTRGLRTERPLLAVRSRVLETGRRAEASLAAHAAEVLEEMRPHLKAGRWALVGECVAATVSLEIARQAEESGLAPDAVVLLDPWMPPWRPWWQRWRGAATTTGSAPPEEPPEIAAYYEMIKVSPAPVCLQGGIHVVLTADEPRPQRAVSYWKQATAGPVHLHRVAGTHDSYIRAEAAETQAVLNGLL